MKLLVLAAGYGTRLKELGEGTPKALLEINQKPLLAYILDRTVHLEGLSEIIVVTNDKFYSQFAQWAKDQTGYSQKIKVINDGTLTSEERLGSIGDIDYVLTQENIEEDVLVVGGDNLFNFNLQEYMEFAREKNNSVTIGLYDIENLEDSKKFGVVSLDDENKVVLFEEKPQEPKSSLVAMCFYYLPKATLGLIRQYLDEIEKSDTAGDYIRWLCEKSDVYGFQFSGKWYDIGSIESYDEAQQEFKS